MSAEIEVTSVAHVVCTSIDHSAKEPLGVPRSRQQARSFKSHRVALEILGSLARGPNSASSAMRVSAAVSPPSSGGAAAPILMELAHA